MAPAPVRLALPGPAGALTDAPRVLLLPARHAPLGATPEAQRQRQRDRTRQALAAELSAWFGLPTAALTLADARGQPPRAQRVDGAPLPALGRSLGLSIAHEAALSLAAWWPGGPVGVDVQRLPAGLTRAELDRLWPLYLGQKSPQAGADVAPTATEIRAFGLAWAMHEARLKCAGLALTEWTPALGRRLAGMGCAELALPAWAAPQHVAALAWAASPS